MFKRHQKLRSILSIALAASMTFSQSSIVTLASDVNFYTESSEQHVSEAEASEVIGEPQAKEETEDVAAPEETSILEEETQSQEEETVQIEEVSVQAEEAAVVEEEASAQEAQEEAEAGEAVEEVSEEVAETEDPQEEIPDTAEEKEGDFEEEIQEEFSLHEAHPVNVTMSVVAGENNILVDDSYTNLALPEYENDLLLSVSPYQGEVTTAVPVENTTRLYISKYDYEYASIDGAQITALRRTPAVNETAGEDGEIVTTLVEGYEYYYSVDGSEYIQILEDTTLYLHYKEEEQKTREYDYNDHRTIHVHAYVNDPAAIPDNADLVVTPITSGQAYEAYMQALNNQAEQIAAQQGEEAANKYDASNTLLYDIAFLAPKADENGNVVPGEFVEIKPDTSQVKITFEFLRNQLTNDLEAESANDITVVHLPVDDYVVADEDKTVDVNAINPNAITADVVNQQNANIAGTDTVEFVADGFSTYAFTVDFAYVDEAGSEHAFSLKGRGEYAVSEILAGLDIEFENITNAELELTEAVGETDETALYLTGNAEDGYVLHSDVAFDDTYTLTVAADEKTYIITVTDDAVAERDIVIEFFDTDGTTPAKAVFGNEYYLASASTGFSKIVNEVYVPTVGDYSVIVEGMKIRTDDNGWNSDDVYLLQYAGDKTDLSEICEHFNSKWNYDETNAIKLKEILDGQSIGAFKITKDSDNSNDDRWYYKAVKQPAYEVEIKFVDAEGDPLSSAPSGLPTNYTLYVTQEQKNNNNEDAVFYYKVENVNLNKIDSSFVIPSLAGENPSSKSYDPNVNTSVHLGVFSIADSAQNGKLKYDIQEVSEEVTTGVAVGTYEFTVVSDANKTTFTGKKLEPYKYSIKEADNEPLSFNGIYNGNWYFLSILDKADESGTYYYATSVALDGVAAFPETGTNDVAMYYTAADGNFSNIKAGQESENNYNSGNTKTSAYQTGDTVVNQLVLTSVAAESYDQIINGFPSHETSKIRKGFSDGDIVNKYVLSSTSTSGVGTLTLTKIPDFKLKTEFKDEQGSKITSGIPADYYLLVKMIRDGGTYYALAKVDGTGTESSESLEFYSIGDNSTKYYYSGKETITTQVITSASITHTGAEIDYADVEKAVNGEDVVHYNENTVTDGSAQNRDLTKNLYSTSSAIDRTGSPYVMTTTFNKQSNSGVDHDITVNFYKERTSSVATAKHVENVSLEGKYYFLVKLKKLANGKTVAYKIVEADTDSITNGKFTNTIGGAEGFILADDAEVDIAGADPVYYDPTVYTSTVRMYRLNDNYTAFPKTIQQAETYGTDTFNDWDFWYNKNWTSSNPLDYNAAATKDADEKITKTQTQLGLYQSTEKIYQVKVYIPKEAGAVNQNAGIKLNETVKHAGGAQDELTGAVVSTDVTSYNGGSTTVTEDGNDKVITYVLEDQTKDELVKYWTTKAGGATPNLITGNETFNLWLTQNDKKVNEGYPVKIGENYYKVSYDTATVNEDGSFNDDNVKVVGKITTITHYVKLEKASFDPAASPHTIIGDAAEFGIIANRYEQYGHTETNYAVNELYDTANNSINGSGTSDIPFYIGKVDGPKLFLESNLNYLYVYMTQRDINNNIDKEMKSRMNNSPERYNLIPTERSEINSYVNSLIAYGREQSAAYAQKTTIKPDTPSTEKDTLDTTSFPDNITIYVDCENITGAMATTGWEIKKLPGQSIVFNVPGTGTVDIAKMVANIYDPDDPATLLRSVSTQTSDFANSNGLSDAAKAWNADIMQHITFNAYDADVVNLRTAGGLILAPKASYVNQQDGAGTILTQGTVVSRAEWHFYNMVRTFSGNAAGVMLEGTKTWDKELQGDDFEFTLTEVADADGTPLNLPDGEEPYTETVRNDADGKIAFSKITYNEEDTHYYKIIEVNGGQTIGGTTYDNKEYIVTVSVTADQNGTLSATVDKPANGILFENTYDENYSASGSITLEGTKTLTGRDMEAEEFEFEVKEGTSVVATGTNNKAAKGEAGEILFSEITYDETQIGEHTYKVTETATSLKGIAANSQSFTIKVNVTADTEDASKLNASIVDGSDAIAFINKYEATGTTLTLKGSKTLVGRAMKDNEFEFQIKEGDKVVATAKSSAAADGVKADFTFSTIEYSEAGEHSYVVTEVTPTAGGVSQTAGSTVKYEFTVNVTDNKNGSLVANVADEVRTKGFDFSNTYTAKETSASVEAFKVLNGRTTKALQADEFEFELTPFSAIAEDGKTVILDSNKTQTAKNSKTGTITFTNLKYDKAGTYSYRLREVSQNANGVTVSTETYVVRIVVEDDLNGQLVPTVKYYDASGKKEVKASEVQFVNEYKAADTEVVLTAKKELIGADLKADQFEFQLKNADGQVIDTKKNAADGTITFAAQKITSADVAKSPLTFTISEVNANETGYIYATNIETIKVTVVDDGKGNLSATPDKTGAAVKFVNEKERGDLKFTKTVKGGVTEEEAKGELTFTVYNETLEKWLDADGNLSDKAVDLTIEVLQTKDGYKKTGEDKDGFTFEFTYKGVDAGKYVVEETNALIDGYKVVAEGTVKKGEATVTKATVGNDAAVAELSDVYQKSTGSIELTKTIKGDVTAEEAEGALVFEIKSEDGKWLNSDGSLSDTEVEHKLTDKEFIQNEDGTYTLKIENVEIGKYTITETTKDVDGNDVTVSYQLNGGEKKTGDSAAGEVKEDETLKVDFEDDYTAVGIRGSVEVTKRLEVESLDGFEEIGAKDQTFYVALYNDEACTQMVEGTEITPLEFKNASAATVEFTDLPAGRTYYVKEVSSDGEPIEAGLVGDDVFTVEFDAGNEAVVSEDGGVTEISFANQFVKIPDGFYMIGELNITKLVLDSDKAPRSTDEVFYAGIFSDEALSTLSDKVNQNIVELNMNGSSKVTETIVLPVYPGEDYDLYIAEVDSEGKLVTGNAAFKYYVSYENDHVQMSEKALGATAVITNTLKDTGAVRVTKHLTVESADGFDELFAIDHTFHVALFEDEDCTIMAEGTKAEDLVFKDSSSATVEFTGLYADRTYYVKELDDDGEPIEAGTVGEEIFTVEFENGNEATVSDSGDITTITFANQFVKIPDGFYKIGDLNITKKVVGTDGSALKTNEVFYAGLFSDAALTTLSDKVDANIIPLNMNGESEVTTTISLPVYPGEGYDLYIAEVDKDGKLVSKDSAFKYSVTYENDHIKMNEKAIGRTVTLKNTLKSSDTTSSETTSAVRTGDDTPIDLYAYLAMAGVLMAAMAEILRCRNRKNR